MQLLDEDAKIFIENNVLLPPGVIDFKWKSF